MGNLSLRNEPVQARSAARLAGLLDAAAAVIDELGYERLTTAMVAERAGASIGTVYRYFPDRIAVLQALGARNLDRALGKAVAEIGNPSHSDWSSAVSAAFTIFEELFRKEPGYRSLRVGDVIDLRPAPNEKTYNSVVSEALLTALAERFDLSVDDETRFDFEAAIEVSDALASRAFSREAKGEKRFLETSREFVTTVLGKHFEK